MRQYSIRYPEVLSRVSTTSFLLLFLPSTNHLVRVVLSTLTVPSLLGRGTKFRGLSTRVERRTSNPGATNVLNDLRLFSRLQLFVVVWAGESPRLKLLVINSPPRRRFTGGRGTKKSKGAHAMYSARALRMKVTR